jgi:transmembrane sensor
MKITPKLIERYLNNACSAEEIKAVDDWYQSFDDHPDPLRLMNDVEQDALKRSIYQRFLSIAHNGNNASGLNKFANFYTIFGAIAGIAALILLVLKPNLSQRAPASLAPISQTPIIAFSNTSLSIYKKVLPDKSMVWLSPNSTLTYPEKFTGNYRKVTLKGEAFFDVTHDEKHPFIIASNELTTKVWGTSFRVRALPGVLPNVAVLSGKVSVNENRRKRGVVLLAGQQATLIHHNKLVKKADVALQNELRIWQKVSLSFDNVKLKDVFSALNKNFDLNIYSADAKLNSLVFTGDFTNQNLPAILDMIKESVDANYVLEGQKKFIFRTNNN